MPRPNKPRTVGAEDRMRAAVVQLLAEHERSIPWLAKKMADAGCPISSASLWKALHRDRAVFVNEAIAIAEVFGVPVANLVAP